MPCHKLKTLSELKRILKRYRGDNKKIVFTNGCFDILHPGHVIYLQKARSLGDVLVVGLNSDTSVKRLKGGSRPIFSQRYRAIVLSALSCVDFVVIFKETTPLKLIKSIKPDILVKGGDWLPKDIVGSGFVKSYGGKVKTIPYIKNFSTSSVVKRLELGQ